MDVDGTSCRLALPNRAIHQGDNKHTHTQCTMRNTQQAFQTITPTTTTTISLRQHGRGPRKQGETAVQRPPSA